MDGVQRSHRPGRVLLALIASLSIIAAACGGSGTQDAIPSTVVPIPETIAPPETVVPPTTETVAGQTNEAMADEEAVETQSDPETDDDLVVDQGEAEPLQNLGEDPLDVVLPEMPASQVLAFALTAIDESDSFSYVQGMRLDMSMMGMEIVMGGEEPLMIGTVDGGRSYSRVEIGDFFMSMFESMGLAEEEGIDEMFDALSRAQIESWVDLDSQTMVYDMSSFAGVLGDLEPGAADELGLLTEGPVSVDMSQFDGELTDVMAELGSGAQVVDPSQFAQVLRGLDQIEASGTSEVNGRAVEVFAGTVSMSQYSAAMGQDLDQLLGAVDGAAADSDDAEMMELMSELPVDVQVMIDADGLLRRLDIVIDMASVLGPIDDSGDDEMDLFGEVTMTLETWQEFDEYGATFDWTPPAAAQDATALFNELGLR